MKLELLQINHPSSTILPLYSVYCLLYSFVKNQLNNKKVRLFEGKIAKSYTTFFENKPNLSEDKFGSKHSSTRIYERFHPLAGRKNKPNQTQNKPDSKPIHESQEMNANPFNKMIYKNFMPPAGLKTKPKRTQFKPNFFKSISSLNFYDCYIRLFFGPDFDKMENWLCER